MVNEDRAAIVGAFYGATIGALVTAIGIYLWLNERGIL